MSRPSRLLAISAALLVTACSSPVPIEPALEARAKAAIAAKKPVPGTVEFRRLWLAEHGEAMGLVCGRIDAPAMLKAHREDLRFVYEDRSRHGQVEYHELWVGPSTGMALIEANRTVFNELWDNHCAPAEGGRLFG